MKRLCFLLAIYGLTACLGWAQDVVYLSDQTKVAGTLADITSEKVTLRVPKGEATIKFSYGVDRVVAVVNQRGRFLCMQYVLALPGDERDRLIQQFLTNTSQPASDAIIRRNPSEAIYGKVSYDQGDVVNYTTADGTAASLPKSDVVAIFYSTGKHELFADAPTLCDNPTLLRNEPNPVPVATASTTPTTVEPAPTAKTDDNWTTQKPAPGEGAKKSLELTAEEYDDYRTQGLERVKDFSVLIGVVADKSTDAESKNKAIKRILTLFKPGATIQVSSMVRDGQANTYSIQDYLRRLKLLPYANVSLEWANIQYVDELTQKEDGNYYGKIRGEQKFSGLNANGEVQYGDITQKDVDVLLQPYNKRGDGKDKIKWAILLGDIGVVATQ
ncbi:hypothetical protein [Spirosoma validum]|uniref:Uncharacterized protein n=1 Tax=Spirosoma validum TaxID=2771355 RepID=A0A927AY05_9BACT|nr:hypothetical protein [Spirosoma validum]MBD2751843.1 hypothetical protein [Spirosoma validum]